MKYKIGDKVKMRENTTSGRKGKVKSYLRKNNYILTIYGVNPKGGYYSMDGWQGKWSEELIIGLYKEPTPINTRFEILDL